MVTTNQPTNQSFDQTKKVSKNSKAHWPLRMMMAKEEKNELKWTERKIEIKREREKQQQPRRLKYINIGAE